MPDGHEDDYDREIGRVNKANKVIVLDGTKADGVYVYSDVFRELDIRFMTIVITDDEKKIGNALD